MRSAFTLFEILLVLAIMVVVLALAFPSIESMYADYRLWAGSDQVRGAWQTARAEAMDKGRAYRFSIVPGQGNYRVAPDSPDYWTSSPPANNGDPDNIPIVIEGVLEKGVRFSSMDSLSQGAGSNLDAPPVTPVGSVSPEQWVTTAIFFPDGTAESDVEILFQMNNAQTVALRLRALTGVITAQRVD